MAQKEYISGEEYHKLHEASSRQPKKVTIPLRSVTLVVGVIVLCVISFGIGISYQKHHTKAVVTTATTSGGTTTGPSGGGFSRRGNGSIGAVTAISSTSITLTNQRTNASDTYAITSSTTITDNGQAVTTSDIQVGDTVLVTTSTSDASTATRILVNPSFGGGFGGQAGGTSSQAN
jgi:hypothetical protein